jgi:glyoxalase family protein
MPQPKILGTHHVTAICGDAQENVDFYTGVLGLRLVKLTVNFDDPGAYHLYYGDAKGSPGTIVTFFPYPGGMEGKPGHGQATELALAIPWGSSPYWESRLRRHQVQVGHATGRFGDTAIPFRDPHGLAVELIAPGRRTAEAATIEGWAYQNEDPVTPENAISGVHSVTLTEADFEETEILLSQTLGYQRKDQAGYRYRYERPVSGSDLPSEVGRYVDVLHTPSGQRGRVAVGSIHHVAFRTANDASQAMWRDKLTELGVYVSPIMNRDYFRSIYFREPGGVLFEIATDGPGFGIDEPPESLGTELRLPEQYQARRESILAALPSLRLPGGVKIGA